MGKVEVKINGRTYVLACNDGEEGRLRELARYLDRTVNELSDDFGQIGDSRLLVMAALTIGDRLSDALGKVEAMQREMMGLRHAAEVAGAPRRSEDAAIREIDNLAERLEGLAKSMAAS
jgi:cell division protein ZapA